MPDSTHVVRVPVRRWFGVLGALVAGALALSGLSPAGAAVGEPVTYPGPTYPSTVSAPTADKPQSKLWYADGTWWGLLVAADSTVRIHELMADHTWRDTGTVVDRRAGSTGDALWDGGKLFVASRHASTPLQVTRFSYDAAARTWSLDPGFPVALPTGGGSESASIDRDSTGRLWVTYTRGNKVWVAHSTDSHTTWTAPFNPAVPDSTVTSDDVSAIVAFRGMIGVLWSDQDTDAFNFALHRDTDPDDVWSAETALAGLGMADDHINLKQLSTDSKGRLFAAIKTEQDAAGPDAMLIGVLVREPAADGTGTWTVVPGGTVADDHTRPIVAIDESNRELYLIATGSVSGGTIYYKKTSLDAPAFPPGRGSPLVQWPYTYLNNATTTKQPVTSASGLVVLAATDGAKRYYHAELALAGGPQPSPTATPTETETVTPTSTESVTGGPQGIGVVDARSVGSAEATSLTVPAPVAAAGDVLLASVSVRGQPTITAPAGWSLVLMTPNGTTLRTATFVRVAGDAEPASHTWTFSSRQSSAGSITAYRGVSAAEPVEAAAGLATTTATTAVTAPSVTTTSAGALVVGVFATAALTTFTPPAGMTERTDQGSPSSASFKVAAGTADVVAGTPGEVGSRTATAGAKAKNTGQLVALRPAPAG